MGDEEMLAFLLDRFYWRGIVCFPVTYTIHRGVGLFDQMIPVLRSVLRGRWV
jgi:hypothetical protein